VYLAKILEVDGIAYDILFAVELIAEHPCTKFLL
jgi:hypothetical protein